MIGIKTGKQIHNRLQRKLGLLAKHTHILFMNRRGIKVFVSKSPIHVKYIRMPYVVSYSAKEEKQIVDFVEEVTGSKTDKG